MAPFFCLKALKNLFLVLWQLVSWERSWLTSDTIHDIQIISFFATEPIPKECNSVRIPHYLFSRIQCPQDQQGTYSPILRIPQIPVVSPDSLSDVSMQPESPTQTHWWPAHPWERCWVLQEGKQIISIHSNKLWLSKVLLLNLPQVPSIFPNFEADEHLVAVKNTRWQKWAIVDF